VIGLLALIMLGAYLWFCWQVGCALVAVAARRCR
jgi:hypothetical protein